MPAVTLRGTFAQIHISGRCGRADYISDSLALGSVEAEPLFETLVRAGETCVKSIAAAREGEIAPIALLPGEPIFGGVSRVASGMDRTIWSTFETRYLKVSENGEPSYLKTLNDGYSPAAVGVDADGNVYGIESARGDSPEGPLRLVDLSNSNSYPVPNGYAQTLVRGNDGHMYFKGDSQRACEIYEVFPHQPPLERTSCIEGPNQQMAIDRSGAIWQANFLGLSRTPRAGNAEDFGPIESPPSDVYCAPCYFPKFVVVQRDDSVWFVYDHRLWRFEPPQQLSNVPIPVGETPTAMSGTTDGSVWIMTQTSVGGTEGTLLRFSPAV